MAYQITDQCAGCGSCLPACPSDAIKPTPEATYRIDPDLCIECGSCEASCPNGAIRLP